MSAIGEWSRRLVAAFAYLLLASGAWGQDATTPSFDDIPAIERNADDFYHAIAIGKNVTASWSADPASVPLGGDIALTLTVRNAANPHELVRPDLRKLPGFADRFQIADGPVKVEGDEARFSYQLRPRAAGTVEILSLKYRYYRPSLPEGKRMQTTYADAITVTATPASAPVEPLVAPEEFFTFEIYSLKPDPNDALGAWYSPALAVPFVVAVYVVVWRWMYPNAARQAAARRNRAARSALDRLRVANREPDPAAAAVAIMHDYLNARWGLPRNGRLSSEIETASATLDRPPDLASDAANFFQLCDALRFGGGDGPERLPEVAADLIGRWERGGK